MGSVEVSFISISPCPHSFLLSWSYWTFMKSSGTKPSNSLFVAFLYSSRTFPSRVFLIFSLRWVTLYIFSILQNISEIYLFCACFKFPLVGFLSRINTLPPSSCKWLISDAFASLENPENIDCKDFKSLLSRVLVIGKEKFVFIAFQVFYMEQILRKNGIHSEDENNVDEWRRISKNLKMTLISNFNIWRKQERKWNEMCIQQN